MSVCKNCGWNFNGRYCPKCGDEYIDDSVDDVSEVTLSSEISDEEREAEARRKLWAAMHGGDVSECLECAEKVRLYEPDDYFANFAEVACSGNDRNISRYLKKSKSEDVEMYADAVLDYMGRHINAGVYFPVYAYKNRSYLKKSREYSDLIEKNVTADERIKINRKRRSDFNDFCMLFVLLVVVCGLGFGFSFTFSGYTSLIVSLVFCGVALCGAVLVAVFIGYTKVRIMYVVMSAIAALFIVLSGVLFIPGGLGTEIAGNGVEYKMSYNCCVVTDYHGSSETVEIPSYYNGKEIISIGKNAFGSGTKVTEVVISGSVDKIQKRAFYECTSLESVKLTYVRIVGKDAFSGCTSLSNVKFGNSLRKIKKRAFYGTVSLESISIPARTKEIGSMAFYGSGLTSANFSTNRWKASGEDLSSFLKSNKTAASLLVDGIDGKYPKWVNTRY